MQPQAVSNYAIILLPFASLWSVVGAEPCRLPSRNSIGLKVMHASFIFERLLDFVTIFMIETCHNDVFYIYKI